jgi:hypothetical protein
MAQAQRTSFEERLARINSGGPNTMGEVHVGPVDEAMVYGKKSRNDNVVRVKPKKNKKAAKATGGLGSILLLPLAALIGAISMFAGEVGAFHMFTDGGMFPVSLPDAVAMLNPYVQYASFALAALLALIFTWTFQFRGLIGKVAVIAGAFAFLWYQPMLVDMYPDVFAAFFSDGYQARDMQSLVETLLA